MKKSTTTNILIPKEYKQRANLSDGSSPGGLGPLLSGIGFFLTLSGIVPSVITRKTCLCAPRESQFFSGKN
jgi:hypothetical protein